MTRSTTTLNYSRLGEAAPTIVFIHPNPTDLTYWSAQQAHLSSWFTTIAVDLPGYGFSGPLRDPVTLEQVAAQVWDVVDELGVGDVVVAGSSIGSPIALHMRHLRPTQCAALVLTACSYRAVKSFAIRRMDGYRTQGIAYRSVHLRDGYSEEFRGTDQGRFALSVADGRAHLVDVESVIRLFEAHSHPDPEELYDVPGPTLIISGSHDYAHDGAIAMSERIAGAELRVIDGGGHACSQEKPWVWDAHLLDFLHRELGMGPGPA